MPARIRLNAFWYDVKPVGLVALAGLVRRDSVGGGSLLVGGDSPAGGA